MLDTSIPVEGMTYGGDSFEFEQPDYVRPADWLPIPDTDSTQDEIYILQGVLNTQGNPSRFIIKGAGNIDWGDGNIETFSTGSSNTFITHQYNFDDLPASSWTSYSGTKQALIHITATRNNIQYFSLQVSSYQYTNSEGVTVTYPVERGSYVYEINVDIGIGVVYVSPNNRNYPSRNPNHSRLEIFKIKNSNYTSISNLFYGCSALQYINELNGTITSAENPFVSCSKLKHLPSLNFASGANCYLLFSGCSNVEFPKDIKILSSSERMLAYLPKLRSLNKVKLGSWGEQFMGCSNLTEIKCLYIPPTATSFGSTFRYCYSLCKVNFSSTKNVTNFSYSFNCCYCLEKIELDASSATYFDSQCFTGTYALKSVKLYNMNPNYTSSLSVDFQTSNSLSASALVELFNSLPTSPAGTRTIALGTTLKGRLNNVYVKDGGELYTIILPTTDTEIVAGKTYYTYDDETDTYTQVTPDFTETEIYYEEYTATWNKYVICESTDEGATLALTYIANKGYTIS